MSSRYLRVAAFWLILWTGVASAAPHRFGEALCVHESYECQEIQKGDTWDSLWPDEAQRDLIQRVNRLNLRLRPGMTLAVPKNLAAVTEMDLSPLPKTRDTGGVKLILVDLSVLAWGAYNEGGQLVHWGPVSAAKGWCPDVHVHCHTPPGTYSVLRTEGARCKSDKYPVGKGGAPMPYCMFFQKGYALHGSPEVPGYHASHGCVRMFPRDAEWLNRKFIDKPNKDNDYRGTTILIEEGPATD